jgi:hypothetical protein
LPEEVIALERIDDIATTGESTGRTGLRIAVGAALCLVAAGGLLWWREGGEVFSRLVTTTLAWCL